MDWEIMLLPYKQAVDEIKVKLENVSTQLMRAEKTSPILSVESRLKSIPSILAKSQRKKILMADIEEKLDDIAGIRIICRFLEDIYRIVDIMKQREDMEIISFRNYVDNMKPSGYRSYHLVIKYPLFTAYDKRTIKCEIQIRTLAMNFWAVTEHSLRYKYHGKIPEDIQKRLIRTADACFLMDTDISAIKDEILEAEKFTLSKEEIIYDITNSIEELYKVAKAEEVENLYKRFAQTVDSKSDDSLENFYDEVMLIAKVYNIR